MNSNIITCCKKCKNKKEGCHDTCIKYTAEVLESMRIRDIQRKESIINDLPTMRKDFY